MDSLQLKMESNRRADDQFMGLTLMSRLARCSTCGLSRELQQHYATEAGRMQLQFTGYLRDPIDGLIYHGARVPPGGGATEHSCCKWGRANGWGLLSHVEVLLALAATATSDAAAAAAGVADIGGGGRSSGSALQANVTAGLISSLEATLQFQDGA